MMARINKKISFTIAELLIVVLIAGILAGISIPAYRYTVEKAKDEEAKYVLQTIAAAELRYYDENNNFYPALPGHQAGADDLKSVLGIDFPSVSWIIRASNQSPNLWIYAVSPISPNRPWGLPQMWQMYIINNVPTLPQPYYWN